MANGDSDPASGASALTTTVAPQSSVAGVVRGIDGRPLGGMTVWLMRSSGGGSFGYTYDTQTTSGGEYRFEEVEPGIYTIRFVAPAGYVGEWWNDQVNSTTANTFEVAAASSVDGMDAVLSTGASISGIVTDPDDVPVASATVQLYGMGMFGGGWMVLKTVSTDENGAYRFTAVAPGQNYAVHVLPPPDSDLVEEWWDDTPYEYFATRFDVARDEVIVGVDTQLPKGGQIHGTVTDELGAPLGGVSVHLVGDGDGRYEEITAYARTEANGEYVFDHLKASTYRVEFTPANGTNFLSEWWGGSSGYSSARAFSLDPGSILTDLDADLAVGGSISGTITGRDNKPLMGTSVELRSAGQTETVKTDDNGDYRIERLRGGSYTLSFTPRRSGYMWDTSDHFMEWWVDAPTVAERTTLDIAAGRHIGALDAQLTPESSISGTITGADGVGMSADIRLYALRDGGLEYVSRGYVLSDGRYYFDELRAGTYTLKTSAPDHLTEWWEDGLDASSAVTFEIATGQISTGMDVQLASGASISGNVALSDGIPFSSVVPAVVVHDESGQQTIATAYPDKNGNFSLRGLREGVYAIEFRVPAGAAFVGEWWDDSPDSEHAGRITLAADQAVVGIDAKLAPVVKLGFPSVSGTTTVGSTLTASASVDPATAVVSYQWLADGTVISGATEKTLIVDPDLLGMTISVSITATALGYGTAAKTSRPTEPVGPGTLTTSTPTISGTAATGSTLTVTPGTWSAGTSFDHQWFADGSAIRDATQPTLALTSDHAGKQITVQVTGSLAGYATIAKTSPATGKVFLAPTPTITGTTVVGATLTAAPGTWTTGTTLKYQWYASGTAITGATAKTFKLTSAQAGKQVTVRVTGSLTAYPMTSRTSAATLKVATVGSPTISGAAATGATLTAKPGTWTTGTTFTYQWYADGTAISGATASTFTPAPAQAGRQLTVRVTGSLAGYATIAKLSPATGKVYLSPTPTLTGTTAVGSTLTASAGTWTTGSTLKYQWYANGTAITGATAKTFKLTTTQAGKQITVRVTGSLTAYPTSSRTSAATLKVATVGSPTISGAAATGATLTAKPGTWTTGTTFTYQWYSNGTAISGATASTFTPASAQAGRQLTVRVTGSLAGYATIAKTSPATGKVFLAPTPTITGTTVVGATLTAAPGTWTTGTTLKYQWYASGTAITGATAKTFKLTSAQAGKQVTVRVTGSLTAYPTTSRTSAATLKVATVGSPTISGAAATGATLTAKPGTWTTGTTFTYQWYADGTAISGATSASFVPTADQLGQQLSVRVTGSLVGYPTVTATSTSTPKVVEVVP
nr:carboxypeptidase regulatory-like domain-containing protein [Agromyces cerinus]